MSARRRAPADGATLPQLELFPERTIVERLDPRAVAGERTTATALHRVRIGDDVHWHRVFSDRHGTYCEEHGPHCRAVREVLASQERDARA
jgi:hypothetical protein